LKRKIGIIGCGSIGAEIAKSIEKRLFEKARLVGISDTDITKAARLARALHSRPEVLSIPKLIRRSDLIVEAASARVSAKVARDCIRAGKDVMIMSVGGLLKEPKIFLLAERKSVRVYIPSGALCGIDAVKAARVAGIDEATLTTSKPPLAYAGSPYVIKNKIDLLSIRKKRTLFVGSAQEAVDLFPQNINVAATLALAGLGAKRTRVRIMAEPALKRNRHQIEVKGKFGRLSALTENAPSPENPKTSYLAVLSAVATLEGILGPVKIGT